MSLLRTKRSVRLVILCTGIGAVVLVCAIAVVPKTSYYLQRARSHEASEQMHESKAREYWREIQGPDYSALSANRAFSDLAEQEDKAASRHARLRQDYRRAAFQFWSCQSDSLPLPYPWDLDRDRQVMEAVFAHIIEDASRRRTTNGDPSIPAPLVLFLGQFTSIEMFEDWYVEDILQPEGLPIEVAADLQRRNAEGEVPLAEIRLRTRQVAVRDLEELRRINDPDDALAWIRVSLPGYSHDGKIALVAVTNAFTDHPSGEVYALRLSGHEWRVVGTYAISRE
jgi:hypothetical protein